MTDFKLDAPELDRSIGKESKYDLKACAQERVRKS